MSYAVTLATNVTTDTLLTPLPQLEEVVIWESAEIGGNPNQGQECPYCVAKIKYTGMLPDTLTVSPFTFKVAAVVYRKDASGEWDEIGRQNNALGKVNDSPDRRVNIGTNAPAKEEGIEYGSTNAAGENTISRSYAFEDASGTIKICLVAEERETSPVNPFQSVTFDASLRRYG